MIKSFGVKNFTCFKDWMELSFEFNDQVPSVFHNNNNISNILCLKGANASGKTNALKSLSFLIYFILDSFSTSPDADIIGIESFFNNDDDTEFFIEFVLDEINYLYEISCSKEEVKKESFEKNGKVIFSRVNNKLENSMLFDNKNVSLRTNASFISTAIRYPDLEKYIKNIYMYFSKIFSNVSSIGFTGYPDTIFYPQKIYELSESYKTDTKACEFMKKYLKKFDTGISDVQIKEKTTPDEKKYYYPVFTHEFNDSVHTLLHTQESSGTRALFNNLLLYYRALSTGGFLILDEFDVNLHTDILPHLIELFIDPENNPNNAQLIFTTHNNQIMEILGKYRIYCFEKEDNRSYCYRLDEIDNKLVRNDRSIIRLYEKGLLGGVPKVAYEK